MFSIKTKETLIALLALAWILAVTLPAIRNHFNVAYVLPADLDSWLQQNSPLVVDLREPQEVSSLPFTYQPLLSLPFLSIEKNIAEVQLPSHQPLLLVCSDGNRARLVATILHEKGVPAAYLKFGLNKAVKQSKYLERE